MYLVISLMLGLLPYIRRQARNILAPAHMQKKIAAVSSDRLRTSCQAGMPSVGSLIIAVTEEVVGMRVNTTEIAWFGFSMITLRKNMGSVAVRATMLDQL
jgi:hypothetical protein